MTTQHLGFTALVCTSVLSACTQPGSITFSSSPGYQPSYDQSQASGYQPSGPEVSFSGSGDATNNPPALPGPQPVNGQGSYPAPNDHSAQMPNQDNSASPSSININITPQSSPSFSPSDRQADRYPQGGDNVQSPVLGAGESVGRSSPPTYPLNTVQSPVYPYVDHRRQSTPPRDILQYGGYSGQGAVVRRIYPPVIYPQQSTPPRGTSQYGSYFGQSTMIPRTYPQMTHPQQGTPLRGTFPYGSYPQTIPQPRQYHYQRPAVTPPTRSSQYPTLGMRPPLPGSGTRSGLFVPAAQ